LVSVVGSGRDGGSFRAAAKRVAQRLLVVAGAPALLRSYRRDDALVLAYHNIVPDHVPPAGDVALQVTRSRFAAQLDVLERTCEPVPLAEVLKPPARRPRRPRVAITFDDAYSGAVTLGGAELAKRDLPATVFVSPGFLGRFFWWDVIAWPDGRSWPTPFRERALDSLAGRDDLVLRAALESGVSMQEPPNHVRVATEDELRRALTAAPLTLGSHTWSHPNLAALPAAEVREELERPLEWLSGRFERVEPIIAYPYGCFSDTVVETARQVGYRGGVRGWGGWIRGVPSDPLRVPRLNVGQNLSMDDFILSTAGLVRS
jgi:peptidoglycan/xylan/chitin deacetylase (PgdA/CDA1 family)